MQSTLYWGLFMRIVYEIKENASHKLSDILFQNFIKYVLSIDMVITSITRQLRESWLTRDT